MEVPYRGTASDSRILGASLIPYTSELLHEPVYFFLFTTLKLISDNYSKKYIRKHFFFLFNEKTMGRKDYVYTLGHAKFETLGTHQHRCPGKVKQSLVSRRVTA